MSRRLKIWVCVGVTVLGLTACSDSPIRVETDPPPRDRVLDVLREETDFFDALPDSQTIDILERTCAVLDEGSSVEDVVTISVASGMDAGEAGSMVVAAATGWCPEYLDQVGDFIERWA